MSPAQRGHDSSATRVTPGSAEHELMSKRANTPIVQDGHDIGEHARLLFRQTLTESPWYRLEVVCEQNQRHFLVGAPHYVSYGSSCGTRGYVAIDCSDSEGPFVYLKDAWRVDRDGIEREGDVLQYLNDEQVDGVPTLVCHSDVEGPGQVSDSQEVWKIRHPQTGHCIMKKHCHYRLVVKEVGLSMSQFENAQELIYLLSTCIEAHRDAYEKGVIHSDISAWNVLIMIKEEIVDGRLVQKRTGLLTDWSMSKRLCALLNAPRQWGRSGTWQFMSAFLLNSPFAGTSIPDEMEAFFHVLLFYVIRFLPHNCRNVEQFVHDYFDGFQSGIAWGQYYCGVTKQAAVIGGKIRLPGGANLEIYRPSQVPIVTHSEADRHPISLILNALLRLFEARYTLLAKRECPVGRVSTSASSAVPSKIKAYFARFKHLRQKPIKKELTSEEWDSLREKALTLEDHHRVIALMGLFVVDSKLQWPEEDKLADQLRPDSDIHSKQDLAGRNT
ncbi:hypothetical protein K466DRAFT_605668 [Polyporus arcularius HHB13444]|uniref:Fungal-type protein kinase domain-containing protein n=1 Tax=Polyporus arcularius HHB13444 TaxID=1314778 RepID=A0A5C3NVK1_9APHY|nr:hypothetical protein K466DRAFT_605668 [Polyporus arcularius HHB13444]